jgi:hypothetical protein
MTTLITDTTIRRIQLFATLISMSVALSACSEAPKHEINWAQVPVHGFQHKEVVELGQLILMAYVLFEATPRHPNPELPSTEYFPAYEALLSNYTPIFNIQAQDNPDNKQKVLYGHIWLDQESSERLIISLRGTDDSQEWVQDFKFEKVDYLPENCCVELGFSEIQKSLSVTSPDHTTDVALIDYLASQKQINEITIVGHSLGSSIATLLAFHTQSRLNKADVKLLTFASPLTGDQNFVNSLQANIKSSIRIVNTPDLVPRTPLRKFGYRHIWHELAINSNSRKHIVDSVSCNHSLNTYLHILNSNVPIELSCIAKE